MRGRILIGAALAMALLAPGAALAGDAPAPQPPAGYLQTLRPVADGVWVMAQSGFLVQPGGNVTIIEQADGFVLVDAGGSPGAARRVVAAVRGLSPKPVKAVIITHWHGDHPQGLEEILKAWPQARTIATAATRHHLGQPYSTTPPDEFRKIAERVVARYQDLAAKAETDSERASWTASARLIEAYAADMVGSAPPVPAMGFDDRLVIDDAGSPVEALFLGRANTDGDAVVWLPRQRVLVAGDVVVAPIPFGFGSYPAHWIATLEKLRAQDFAVLVPGHGEPQTDGAYLDRLSAVLTDVRAQVAPLVAQGLSLEQVRAKVDLSVHARAFVGDDPWLRYWFEQYWVQPIVASAWKEARGEPIVQGEGE